MLGNPLCEMRDYRLRILENDNIQMLDDVEIKPKLRTYLAEMERRAELEDIMEATTQDYMDSISLERETKVSWPILEANVGFLPTVLPMHNYVCALLHAFIAFFSFF